MSASHSQVDQIVGDLYAGTLDDIAWNRAIRSIVDLARGASATLFGINPLSATIFRAESHGFDKERLREYCATWFEKEIRFQPALALSIDEPIFDAKLMPIRTWQRSEIYNDFLAKLDRPWFLCFWLHKALDKFSILAIHGSLLRGPLDERDAEAVKPLIPHLRRALEIKDRLDASRIQVESLTRSLGSVNFGVVVLDSKARVLEANAPAVELMSKGCGVARNPDGTLWLRGPAGSELERWIVHGSPVASNPDGLLHVPQLLGRPISILVAPLPTSTESWITGNPKWLLLFFDPSRRIAVSTDVIARDLNISNREARVAALLAEGHSVEQAAMHLKISINTTRTHLKSVFSKTGMSSQAELIRLIVSGPSVVMRQ